MTSELSEEIAELVNERPTVRRSLTNPKLKAVLAICVTITMILSGVFLVVFALSYTGIPTRPKNLVFLIGDGLGPASISLARLIRKQSSNENLKIDPYLIGTVRTRSFNRKITDSAAAATAYSCGNKTNNIAVAVDKFNVPCGTILEASKVKNMRIGLVSTSEVTHATPAAFSAHSVSRYSKYFIAEQQINLSIDVQFGGGRNVFKSDNERLLNLAKSKGIKVLTDLASLRENSDIPVLGLFADDHMAFEIDRVHEDQPSLAEMTRKAIELLDKDHKHGFILIIEGSRIDMAAHNNDLAAHYRDILALDEAFSVVLDFAKNDTQTLVILTADHETGGLTLGTDPSLDFDPDNLISHINRSTEFIFGLLSANFSDEDLRSLVLNFVGFVLSDQEIVFIRNSSEDPQISLGQIIARRVYTGWSTIGHTAVDVNLYAYGRPSSLNKLSGNQENSDIGRIISEIFELDLGYVTEQLKNFDPHPPSNPLK